MAYMLEIRKSMWIDDGMSGLNKIATSQLGTSQCSSQLRFKSTPLGFTRRHQSPWQTGEQTLWTKYSKNNLKAHRDCQGMFQIWIGLQFILFLAGSAYLRDTTYIKWECNSLQTKWKKHKQIVLWCDMHIVMFHTVPSALPVLPWLCYLDSRWGPSWTRCFAWTLVPDGSGWFRRFPTSDHPQASWLNEDIWRLNAFNGTSTCLYIFSSKPGRLNFGDLGTKMNKKSSIVKRLSVVELEWTWHILNHLSSKQNIFLLANGFDLKTNVVFWKPS